MLIISIIAIALFIGADQLVKIWAIDNLAGGVSRQFIKFGNKEILNLTYVENDGAIFGSFGGMRWLLIGLTAVLIIVCSVVMVKNASKSKFLTSSLALVIGGGIGNLIDRIFRNGLVIDYIEVRIFNFAVFNLADCFVTVGTAMLFIYVLFLDKPLKKSKRRW